MSIVSWSFLINIALLIRILMNRKEYRRNSRVSRNRFINIYNVIELETNPLPVQYIQHSLLRKVPSASKLLQIFQQFFLGSLIHKHFHAKVLRIRIFRLRTLHCGRAVQDQNCWIRVRVQSRIRLSTQRLKEVPAVVGPRAKLSNADIEPLTLANRNQSFINIVEMRHFEIGRERRHEALNGIRIGWRAKKENLRLVWHRLVVDKRLHERWLAHAGLAHPLVSGLRWAPRNEQIAHNRWKVNVVATIVLVRGIASPA